MKQIIIGLWLIFSISIFADSARQQYLMKDYTGAKNSYLALHEKSPNNFSYNYNLGSTFFRMENYLLSKFYFLKALKVQPNNNDTKYNLGIVNKNFIDKQFIFKRYWNHIFILNIQTISVLLMIITAIALSIIYNGILDGKSRRLKRLGLIICSTLVILNILGAVFWITEPDYAIIKPDRVQIYSGPSETQKPLFFAHIGAECKIIKSSAVWTNIQFPNGLKGWVKQKDILKI